MSDREQAISLINQMPDHKLKYIVQVLTSIKNLLIDEVPPDSWDLAMIAEAEREKQAVITKAEGEVEASQNLAKAAAIMSSSPGALHLRTLATLNDLSSDQSNTIIFAGPIETLRAMEGKVTDEQVNLAASVIDKLK